MANFDKENQHRLKKRRFFKHGLFLSHRLLPLEYAFTYAVEIKFLTYLLGLIKRISKVHQRNISQEGGLNFDH